MKRLILLAILCFGIFQSQAQEVYNSTGKVGKARYKDNQTKKGFDPHRLIFGGGLGLAFGSVTNIYVAPSVGYRITDKFAAGVSLGYNYYREKDAIYTYNLNSGQKKYMDFTQSIYTGSIWGRYIVIPNIMLQAEFEVNNITSYDYTQTTFDKDGWAVYPHSRLTIPSLLLGGGYRQPIGETSSFFILAMYDVLQDLPGNTRTDVNGSKYSISPYANRVDIRFGFALGF
jgi:hypothetical protein